MRTKGDCLSEDRTMEEDDGFVFWIWGVAEVIDVAIRAQAADDVGAWRSIQCLALGADGDFAIVADADAGLLAPDKHKLPAQTIESVVKATPTEDTVIKSTMKFWIKIVKNQNWGVPPGRSHDGSYPLSTPITFALHLPFGSGSAGLGYDV